METNSNDYRISFFKPTTDSARRNRNMVLQLVIVCAVAGKNTLVHVVSDYLSEYQSN